MSAKKPNRLPARVWHFSIGGILLSAGAMSAERTIAAPNVIANPIPAQPLTTQYQQDQPDEMAVFQPVGQAADVSLPEVFQYGPLQLRPHADYRFLYGNGIQSTPGDQQATIIQQLSPGLLIRLGDHWALDYTPTLRFYSSDKFTDGVDHSISLTGGFFYDDWKFNLSHSSQFTTAPMVQTGSETEQTAHVTTFNAARALTSDLSVDLGLDQQINLVSGFQDSYDWSTMEWLNYKFWPRLNGGIGLGGGYVLVDGNNQAGGSGNLDQTYEQLQARLNWRITDKISVQVNGGFEDRQFSTPGTGDSLDPIFGATIEYQLFKHTQISLVANRTVSSSDYYLAAQQTETTSVGVNLSQQLFRKFILGVGANYGWTDYSTSVATTSASMANRSDDGVSFNARLSHPFFKRGTWSVFYQYSDNRSSQAGFTFESNQTGFEISYAF